MVNKFVFIGIIALIIGTAAVLVASGGDKSKTSGTNTNTSSEQQAQIDEVLAQYTGNGGTFVRYNQSNLDSALAASPDGDKNVLFFEGKTCPSCKQLSKNIEESDIPDGVHIFNLLAEDNPTLMQKYRVRGTPGLYQVDSKGIVIHQLQPVLTLDNILLQLK